MKKYKLTPSHRSQLEPWAKKWIANAMSTAAMTEDDRAVCREAVRALYAAAAKPPPIVVFAPSPFVAQFAGGFAAAIWHGRAATDAATWAATRDATEAATWDATEAATGAATRAATRAATWDATWDATRAATEAATWDANTWYVAGADFASLARRLGVGKFGLQCAQECWQIWQGGNQWSAYDSLVTFFRHIAKLPIDYSRWDAWERLSLHSGPRVVHQKFCIISDRPELLTVDDQNRPHADDGPFCRWRDGSALYAVHGVRVPQYVVERPDMITVAKIDAETNAEVKRVMIDRYKRGEAVSGAARFLADAGSEKLDHDEAFGTLHKRSVKNDEPIVILEVTNRSPEPDGSYKHYWLRVPPTMKRSAVAWRWLNGLKPKFNPDVIQT